MCYYYLGPSTVTASSEDTWNYRSTFSLGGWCKVQIIQTYSWSYSLLEFFCPALLLPQSVRRPESGAGWLGDGIWETNCELCLPLPLVEAEYVLFSSQDRKFKDTNQKPPGFMHRKSLDFWSVFLGVWSFVETGLSLWLGRILSTGSVRNLSQILK